MSKRCIVCEFFSQDFDDMYDWVQHDIGYWPNVISENSKRPPNGRFRFRFSGLTQLETHSLISIKLIIFHRKTAISYLFIYSCYSPLLAFHMRIIFDNSLRPANPLSLRRKDLDYNNFFFFSILILVVSPNSKKSLLFYQNQSFWMERKETQEKKKMRHSTPSLVRLAD
jgi:hypothetical protein